MEMTKEDIALENSVFVLWQTRVMDTKLMSNVLKVPESRVYNILSKILSKRRAIRK